VKEKPPIDEGRQEPFAAAEEFEAHRQRLMSLAAKHLDPVLARRMSPEDVVQETFAAAMMREDFFTNAPEVPIYFKLRTILFQTLADIERRHLAAQKRDAYRDVEVPGHDPDDTSATALDWDMFAGTVTSPKSALAREDRHALLRQAIAQLSDNDREIIILRHFDDMDNAECARTLGIEPKAASIRYVRALERLQAKLEQYSEFAP
jgi:RNA polymerase sigma-70 factor (ECF subfamily)